MEKDKINLIEPLEGKNTHIESHKELNRYVSLFYGRLNNIEDKLNNINNEDVDEKFSSAFSEIREIKKDVKELKETLGCMAGEIKDLKEKVNKPKKYLVKHFEGILDTDTEIVSELDKIELDGTYLVNIVENEIIRNESVMAYTVGHTAIANNEYTPRVYVQSVLGGHAVLEYDFTVILTEI